MKAAAATAALGCNEAGRGGVVVGATVEAVVGNEMVEVEESAPGLGAFPLCVK